MLLSCKDEDLMAGNFMADFIPNSFIHNLTPAIKLGVDLHRQIDSFTDHHPDVKASVLLFRPTQRKYAPVVVDIVFDYLLTQHWTKYSAENIHTFTRRVYDMLDDKKDSFPPRLKELLPKMIADDFLLSCSTKERLIKTFVYIKKRAKFDNHFDTAHHDLFDNYEALDLHFNSFFPDLMVDIHQFCDCN